MNREDIEAIYPLSPLQHGLLFHTLYAPDSGLYFEQISGALHGRLDVSAFERAWQQVIDRHSILRTSFYLEQADRPLQVVQRNVPLPLDRQDWRGLPSSEQQQKLAEFLGSDRERGFDPSRAPLMRLAFIRLSDDVCHFVWSFHHVLLDGWSLGIVLKEVFTIHEALVQGEQLRLAPSRPYRDYIAWLQQQDVKRAESYWREILRGFTSPTPVGVAASARSAPGSLGEHAQHSVGVSTELTAALQNFARQHQLTVNTVVQGVWALLLSRYSGEDDVVFGITSSGRPTELAGVEGIVGLFVNSLPFRVRISSDDVTADWLKRLQVQLADMRQYEYSSLVQVQEWSVVPRGMPLFESLIGFENYPLDTSTRERAASLNIRDFRWVERTNYALTAMVVPGQQLLLQILYDVARFDTSEISRFGNHFKRLLESIVLDPSRKLVDVPMLDVDEQQQIVFERNDTRSAFPRDVCIHHLFEQQVALQEDAIAVRFGQRQLTYAELNAEANRLAHYLQRLGVVPGAMVGLYMDRSVDLVVAFLAVLKAGGAYLPLDASYPRDRLAFLLEDAGASVLLTQDSLVGALPAHTARIVCLDRDRDAWSDQGSANPVSDVTSEHLAYVIYTSGSTGQPKGVAVPHRAVTRLVRNTDYVQLTPADVVAQASNASFDAVTFEIWGALLNGAVLVGISKEVLLAPLEFASVLKSEHITTLFITTALFNQIAKEAPGAFSTLRQVLFGGELVDVASVRRVLEDRPPNRLLHVYGPTETTTFASWYEVQEGAAGLPSPGALPLAHTIPIGRPLANTTLYVLDQHLHPVPIGVPGELYIGGDGVAREYFRRPELTAEKFVPDPFGGDVGSRLYRTGDRVRRKSDGNIEFIERIDQQVKLRGFRIELGEIESALDEHPEILESVVVVREDTPGDRRLVAYVVRQRNAANARVQEREIEHVEQWKELYEQLYRQDAPYADPTFNVIGWNSSYTGQPLPESAMREWLDRTVARIVELRPTRVLEIGCGTGLLLFRIAPETSRYLATDFSHVVLDHVGKQVIDRGLTQVELSRRLGDDFSGIEPESFDCVILNSIVQYFPDIDYLRRVLAGAARAVAQGGAIFIGDVRSLPLLEVFHTAVELHQSEKNETRATLKQRVRQRIEEERELVIDPRFFIALQQELREIGAVEIRPKRGHERHELTQFRYDVVLHVGDRETISENEISWHDWERDALTIDSVRRRLAEESAEVFGVRGVPNARVTTGIDPEDVWQLSNASPYDVEISWARASIDGSFDVVFCRKSAAARPILAFERSQEQRPWRAYANNPLRGLQTRALGPELRRYLKNKLPEYMLPAAFVVLDELPLTPNGKVDRRALPAPDGIRSDLTSYVAPRSPVEEVLAAIWTEVLKVERIGVHDGFFESGGHSLLATQVISRIREVLQVDLPLRSLFESPTVAGLAQRIEDSRATERGLQTPPIVAVSRDRTVPLSFAQLRLWFLERLAPGSRAYHVPAAVRLTGPLDVPAVEQCLNEIVRRHEALRTSFHTSAGIPVQIVAAEARLALAQDDLTGLPPEAREFEVRRRFDEEAQQPFDLEQGPLLRAMLLRLGPEEHVLLSTMHHIVSDGWSIGVFIREAAVLYEAFATGSASPLPDLAVQYADYAVWQHEWLQGPVLDKQLAYWKQQLTGVPTVLELPLDLARPPLETYRGTNEIFQLPRRLTDALRALSRREGVTIFMTLLAAFEILLQRYSGQEEFIVGTPIANRNRRETEGLIGFFVNTIALRADLSGNPTVEELLGRVRKTALDAYDHQDLAFEKLVEELQPQRDMSRHPLFQVMFVLQNAPMPALKLPGLSLSLVEVENQASKFDLTMSMMETPEGLAGSVEYNIDLFLPSTIRRLLGHLQTLLQAMAKDSSQRIADLPILTDVERRQILVDWNATANSDDIDHCLHTLIEQQVERTPDSIALVYEEERLSYRELNARANQLAHYLRSVNVGPDVVVGVCAERSIEMVVGLLGILKAGGAYLPLDPTYPRERLAFMMENANVSVVLTQEHLSAAVAAVYDRRIVSLDSEVENPAVIDRRYRNHASPLNIAYVIYTSGSTGKPKGVMTPHRGIVNRLLWMQRAYKLTPADRVLQKTPFGFDVSVWEFFWPLLTGATLVMAKPNGHQDPAYLVEVIAREKITTVHFVPSMLQAFLESPGVERCRDLRQVIASGEALPVDLEKRFFARLDAPLHNLYGPTEASVDVTYWPCEPNNQRRSVPIGRPIANTQIYILDPHLAPQSIGVPGELHIGGVGLARGYLAQPEWTAERFIPDPFSRQPGARLYKTGDLARWLPDGTIEFIGRIDHQVKLRGFRIELGEIESALLEHPSVRECAVIAADDATGDKHLVAYVVPSKESPASPSVDEIRRHLSDRLPDYMIPSAFVVLDALPLSSSGKIDRRALPAPTGVEASRSGVYVAPRNPIEEVMAGIWGDVLGIERVGIHDNFFEFGGHSLRATQVISRVRAAFEVELPLRLLFESPTVAGLASAVSPLRRGTSAMQREPDRPKPPVKATGGRVGKAYRPSEIPLSFAQQRLWFLDQLEPGIPAYNMPMAVRLRGSLNTAAVEQSLNEIVRRHETLRTTFSRTGARPFQKIANSLAVPLPIIDLRDISETDREAEALRFAGEEARRPFDLTRGPLLRASLLELHDDEHILLLTIHHVIADGWSMGVFLREIVALYDAFENGRPSPLQDLPIQYADFAIWQREWLQGDVLDAELSYWKQQLAELPQLELPADHSRGAVQSFDGGTISFDLPEALAQTLHALSRREGVTLFMTLMAAFDVLLYRYSGQRDIVVGTGVANRNRGELEGLIGFFVNMLVLRVDLSGNPTFRKLLARVRQVALDAYDHQDLPFEKLVEELQPERNLSRHPLFQVACVLQNAPVPQVDLPGLSLHPIEVQSGKSKFDLTLFLWESERTVGGSFEYNAQLFKSDTIARMAEHFQSLLKEIVRDPDQTVGDLRLLRDDERRQLLLSWNMTETASGDRHRIHEVVAQRASEQPFATAVVDRDRPLTYQKLNDQANRLANHLRSLGVGPDTIVAVFLDRSVEFVVALLAILKAGGAYLPLDSSSPLDRIALLLADSRAELLLTDAARLTQLPEHSPQTFCLDRDAELWNSQSAAVPESSLSEDHLAYVIYTSGSTGRPKAVAVTHAGLTNLVEWHQRAYGVGPHDRASHLAGLSFDASVWELWPYLASGATLYLADDSVRIDPVALTRWLAANRITLSFLPTPLAESILALGALPEGVSLRAMLTGGDRLHAGPDRDVGFAVINHYGPTENSVVTTCAPVGVGIVAPPIGRPIANTRVYVLDERMQPVPVGVPGELYIGGIGLARGYLHRPDWTAEKFVPDSFSGLGGARLYRTGDRVRWLSDGQIEFVGRIDDQVKVRGFRIEPGEIEHVLANHPDVIDCAVAAVDDRRQQDVSQSLVAYVVTNAADSDAEPLTQWQQLYDETYAQSSKLEDPTFNITGWNSSYTGEPIGEDAMREWVDHTVSRILALKPRRVMEIGCGTGLLLFRIALQTEHYVGTDFSSAALDYLGRHVEGAQLNLVELWQRNADDFTGVERGRFDCVIINSVVQYFPNVEYLIRVLQSAIDVVAPGGSVFVGDVRNLLLLEAFHASVQLEHAQSGTAREELRRRVRQHVEQDPELVIDPALFLELASRSSNVAGVEVMPKRGCHRNELTQFRYDVVLRIGTREAASENIQWRKWKHEDLHLAGLNEILLNEPDVVALRDIPNERVRRAVEAVAWLHDDKGPATPATIGEAVDPEAIWALAEKLHYAVEISWGDTDNSGRYDVLLRRRGASSKTSTSFPHLDRLSRTWADYANRPVRPHASRGIISKLRRYLEEKLPEYMVPSAFLLLDRLPLTPSGKVDRRALPAPLGARPELPDPYVAPRNAVEQQLSQIWTDILGVDVVGVHDSFFELGGHSLLAMQLAVRIREQLDIELPLRSLFEAPTIATVAETILALRSGTYDQTRSETVTDLHAEVALDPAIRLVAPYEPLSPPGAVFITGASGFLGAFLLREILDRTQADVYCLVRAVSPNEGLYKLKQNLSSFSLWNDRFASRVIAVPGDLAEPLLGLRSDEFDSLAERIDVIYHGGALVNAVAPYSRMKAPNVLGTQEVLRLAATARVKPVHYISTLGVFPSVLALNGEMMLEDDALDRYDGLLDGYSQSKWVAEKLMMLARSRGFPVAIYRPGGITAHSETGVGNADDLMSRLLKGCVQLGSVPRMNMLIDMTPVDFVARAVVHLSMRQESVGKAFHLFNPSPLSLTETMEWLRSVGYPLRSVPFAAWREEVLHRVPHQSDHALYPLLPLFVGELTDEQLRLLEETVEHPLTFRWDCRNTIDGLAGSDIQCPHADTQLLSTYLARFIDSGFLDPV